MNLWTLSYEGYDPAAEGLREALCTLGNGYMATRGASTDGGARTPGTYVAGCYDRLTSPVAGRTVTNEDLVNLPDWLPLTVATHGSAWFRPESAGLLDYHRELDLRHGVLHRTARWRDAFGRTTLMRQRRLVSMAEPHLAALETTCTALDWSGPLRVRSTLDGTVANRGVYRYRNLRGDHLTRHAVGAHAGTTWLTVRTRASQITVALASRIDADAEPSAYREPERVATEHVLDLVQGEPATVTKTVALVTSRDHAIHDPRSAALRTLRAAPCFDVLLEDHRAAWERLWDRADVELSRQELSQLVHLHIFHVLQTLSPHTADLDVGVPARGLHGEAYRGHVFWDELFVLPWLDLHFPEISRGLLRYRWRRLPPARQAAREAGHDGAMFPWQSGSDGQEETPGLHLNPSSGHWLPDRSHLQRHVGLAIAYNVWHHCLATGERPDFCAELLLDIARFFASLARKAPESGRYEISGVMGPDEYHDEPQANNAYTNIMTVWLLSRARELPGVTGAESRHWDDICHRMRVDFHDGVISQFTGYGDLRELDWDRYRGVRRLDRALEADGEDVNRYKASKQADVLMLLYLLTDEELVGILEQLGYRAPPDLIPRTVGYYLARTSHGSTLSAVVHAWVLARTNRSRSWAFLVEALTADFEDVQGGTTAEGIHLGAMAGTLDLLQRCYLGLRPSPGELLANPIIPRRLGTLSMPLTFRGRRLLLEADSEQARISGHGRVLVCRTGQTTVWTAEDFRPPP
jgi:trehalose/maltose hydrolase-like predicted phosphorylase